MRFSYLITKPFLLLVFISLLSKGNIFLQEKIIQELIPSAIAFKVVEKDLFPEGITYDPITKLIFLSSVQKKKLLLLILKGIVLILLNRVRIVCFEAWE